MRSFHVVACSLLALPLVHCAFPMMPQQPGAPGGQGGQGGQAPLQEPAAAGAPATTGAGVTPGAGSGNGGSAAGPSTSSFGSPAAPGSEAAGGAPSAPIPTTVEIHSDCTKTTPVFYGEKPKFGGGTKSSIGSNTTTSVPRKADGTLTVWIIDEQENGVASVRVEPSTRRVEIDRGCRQITAR